MYLEQAFGLMSLVLSTLSGFATLVIALQLILLRKTYDREVRANQMERTLEAVRLSQEVAGTISATIRQGARGVSDQLENGLIPTQVASALNALDTLAAGIRADVYDEELAYSSIGFTVLAFHKAVAPLIYESRSYGGFSNQYIQLELLVRQWAYREPSAYGQKMEGV